MTRPREDVDALLARIETESGLAHRLIDVAVVARRMNVSDTTIYNWIAADRITVVKTPTGRYRVPLSELARLLKINSQASQACQP